MKVANEEVLYGFPFVLHLDVNNGKYAFPIAACDDCLSLEAFDYGVRVVKHTANVTCKRCKRTKAYRTKAVIP